MTDLDSVLPVWMSIDDPFIDNLAANYPQDAAVRDSCILLGRCVVMVAFDPKTGENHLVYPRGAFGESVNTMEESVRWKLRDAKTNLSAAYVDMDETPELGKEVKAMIKRLGEMDREISRR